MVRSWSKVLLALTAVAGLAGCSASGGGSGDSPSTTYSISGTMSVGAAGISAVGGFFPMAAASDACADGNYYQVYCVSFSSPPVAAQGDVSCGAGTSGGFTVSGLPLDTAIGCFVRRSETGAADSYDTLGSIEIPATGLGGTSSTISSDGDLGMNISVSETGEITATVTSGEVDESTATTDATAFNGIYRIRCAAPDGVFDAAAVVKCKCRNFDHQNHVAYNSTDGTHNNNGAGGMSSETACMNDNASEITEANNTQYVDVKLFNATASSDIGDNGKVLIPAGASAQAISVWQATDATTSSKPMGSGEGAPTFGGALTWEDATVDNAITWTTGGNYTVSGINNITFPAVPANNATVGDWQQYVRAIAAEAATNGWSCTWGSGGNPDEDDDANCLAEASQKFLENNGSLTLPRVRLERKCGSTGCAGTVNESRVFIDGIHFQYTEPWTGNQSAITPELGGIGASPKNRYVFEKWEAFPSGGGGFTQGHHQQRWFACDDIAGKDIQSALCTGTNNWVECGGREEQRINFIPTGTSGQYSLVFNGVTAVFHAKLSVSTGMTTTESFGEDVRTLCEDAFSAGGDTQYMQAVKQ